MHLSEAVREYYAMDLAGVDILPDGRMVPSAQVEEQPPRAIALRHLGGYSLLWREDLPLLHGLGRLPARAAFRDPGRVARLLALQAPVTEIWQGRSLSFTRLQQSRIPGDAFHLTRTHQARLENSGLHLDPAAVTAYALVVGDCIAATCWSTRENVHGAEAYVYTRPEYRRRGLGTRVVLAWALDLQPP